MSQENFLTFENDPLILERDNSKGNYTTVNDIIKKNELEALSIENVPNIFGALIKYDDFQKKVPLHNIPYVTGKSLNNTIKKLLKELPEYTKNNHLQIRRFLKIYMKRKITKQYRNYIIWFGNGRCLLVFLRLLAWIYSRKKKINEKQVFAKIIEKIETIENAKGEGNLSLPKTMSELLTKDKAYILGASTGDGCLLLNDSRWATTDGHKDINALPFSYEYLKNINEWIRKEFGISGNIRNGPGKKYVLMINNKFFCRLLNFFCGIRFGVKMSPEVPLIFNLSESNHELKRHFFTGLIDTDGSILRNSPNMQIEMNNSDNLINQLSSLLSETNIENSMSVNPPSKRLFIPTKSFKNFVELIDLRHHYKHLLALNHLKKGTKERFLKSVIRHDTVNFLEKYSHNLRVLRTGKIIKTLIEKSKSDKMGIANILNVKEKTINAWINNVNSIQLKPFIKIGNLCGHNTNGLLKELLNNDVKWGYGQTTVRIPEGIDNVIQLAKFIRPGHSYVYVANRGNINRNKIISQMKDIFGVMPSYEKSKNTYRFSSEILRDYFNFFFNYENPW